MLCLFVLGIENLCGRGLSIVVHRSAMLDLWSGFIPRSMNLAKGTHEDIMVSVKKIIVITSSARVQKLLSVKQYFLYLWIQISQNGQTKVRKIMPRI